MSLDNSLMMEIYPFGGLFAYLKFHFIDGINKQSLMLLDKTRVDYDSKGDKREVRIKSDKSEAEVSSMLSRFGVGSDPTEEERAEIIRNELENQ